MLNVRERSHRRWDSEAMSTFDAETTADYDDECAAKVTHEIDEDEGPYQRGLGASQDSAAASTFTGWRTFSGTGVVEGKGSED